MTVASADESAIKGSEELLRSAIENVVRNAVRFTREGTTVEVFPASFETPGDGAGLGLAITERAVKMHGGTVRAMNAPDGGLIVEIELLIPAA